MAAFDKYEIKDLFKDTGVLPPSKFMNLIDGLWRPNLWLYNEQLLSENDLEKVNPEDENYDARYLYEPNSFLTAGDEDIYSWSQAYGYGHVVRANFAQVFGHANQANGMFETVMGSYATKSEAQTAKEWVVTDRLWTLGNGYDDDNRSDALTIYKSGFGVWDNAIAIGLYSHGGVEPIDGSIQFLLDSSEGYLQVYYNSQWNDLTIGSHTAVEKFIELYDCPTNYADRYALISDAENSQIIYSTVHGAAPKWFFVDQGCPNPQWDPEILINGDFAAGDTGWTVPAGWSTETGAAVHTAGNTGALTQEVEGSTLSGTYKLEIVTSGITAGTITITVHAAVNDAQLGETYVIGASNQGAGLCLFELAARDNYIIKITPSTAFNGTIDDCSFKKGHLGNSIPQIRGYTFNHTNVGPFEVAWRNNDLYIGRNAGYHGGLGVGGVVAVTPDGMTTVTGGYNITALGHTVGNGITNEHDLILIGTGVTVDTEQNNWLKIGIGSNEILEGDLSNLDLFPKGNLKVYKNITVHQEDETYLYALPDAVTLVPGRILQVQDATPNGKLRWSPFALPVALPETTGKLIKVNVDGTSEYIEVPAASHNPVTIAEGSTAYLGLADQVLSIDLSSFAGTCKWVYDAVEQDLTYTETLGYGHVGINVTDPLFCLDIEESFRVDDGRGFHFRFDMQGAFIIQPATYIRNSSLFEIQQLHATESGRLLVMKQHAEGDYLSLWKYNGSTYVQKFKINHLGVMTSSGVTYPSAVPSANGQVILGNTDGTTSWGSPSASVPGTETLTYAASVAINWNGNTTATLAITGACELAFGTPANYVKRLLVTGNYSLTLPAGAKLISGTYDGAKDNIIDLIPAGSSVYVVISNA